MSVQVYWCSRTVGGTGGNFNHHFALIIWERECPAGVPLRNQNGKSFVTLGAYPSNENAGNFDDLGNLIFIANAFADVEAARLLISQSQNENQLDAYKPQWNLVNPPRGNAGSFAYTLMRMAAHYGRYDEQRPIEYDRNEMNSNSWNNSLFKSAGVPDEERRRLQNFKGWDVAERQVIPATYFGG